MLREGVLMFEIEGRGGLGLAGLAMLRNLNLSSHVECHRPGAATIRSNMPLG